MPMPSSNTSVAAKPLPYLLGDGGEVIGFGARKGWLRTAEGEMKSSRYQLLVSANRCEDAWAADAGDRATRAFFQGGPRHVRDKLSFLELQLASR